MPDPDGYLNRGQPISTVSKTMPVELPTSFTPIRNPMLPRSSLLPINQQSEGLRNYLRPGMRILGCGWRWRFEFGRHGINNVAVCVECHCSRPALRRDRLDYAVFVRRILMRHRNRPVIAGGKC